MKSLPRIRTVPEDFLVEEIPLSAPEGEGEHVYLWVEKRLRNTEEVARKLAALANVAPGQVGFAGRKDRAAVARQWISVPRVAPREALSWELEGVRILEAVRGRQRIRLGELAGNRFQIRVRPPEGEGSLGQAAEGVGERLQELAHRGCPNVFGRQRFGRGGDNVRRGLALLRGEDLPAGRRLQGLLVAAVQAQVFNEILSRRPWPVDELVPGDLARVEASGRLFVAQEAEAGTKRLQAFRVSPTAPLFGFKTQLAEGEVGDLEGAVLESQGLDDLSRLQVPPGVRMDGERRPLRFPVRDAATDSGKEADESYLDLSFTLPSGSYATVVLDQLFPAGVSDASQAFES